MSLIILPGSTRDRPLESRPYIDPNGRPLLRSASAAVCERLFRRFVVSHRRSQDFPWGRGNFFYPQKLTLILVVVLNFSLPGGVHVQPVPYPRRRLERSSSITCLRRFAVLLFLRVVDVVIVRIPLH